MSCCYLQYAHISLAGDLTCPGRAAEQSWGPIPSSYSLKLSVSKACGLQWRKMKISSSTCSSNNVTSKNAIGRSYTFLYHITNVPNIIVSYRKMVQHSQRPLPTMRWHPAKVNPHNRHLMWKSQIPSIELKETKKWQMICALLYFLFKFFSLVVEQKWDASAASVYWGSQHLQKN